MQPRPPADAITVALLEAGEIDERELAELHKLIERKAGEEQPS